MYALGLAWFFWYMNLAKILFSNTNYIIYFWQSWQVLQVDSVMVLTVFDDCQKNKIEFKNCLKLFLLLTVLDIKNQAEPGVKN